MFHGQIIHAFEAALSAAGVGHGVIVKNLPFLVTEAIEVASGLKPLPVAIVEVLAKFAVTPVAPPTPAPPAIAA